MLHRVNIVCFYQWGVAILIAVLRYLFLDWNIRNIENPAILVSLLKVRHFEMSAMLKCPQDISMICQDAHMPLWYRHDIFLKAELIFLDCQWNTPRREPLDITQTSSNAFTGKKFAVLWLKFPLRLLSGLQLK